MKELKEYEGIRVGDTVAISEWCGRWATIGTGQYPGQAFYPIIGVVEKMEEGDVGKNKWVAALVNDYGISLKENIDRGLVKVISRGEKPYTVGPLHPKVKKEQKPSNLPFDDFFIYHGGPKRIGTVVGKFDGDILKLSCSIRSHKDTFCRAKGRNEAIKRYNIMPQWAFQYNPKAQGFSHRGQFFYSVALGMLDTFKDGPSFLIKTK